jgi:hypothetical protein
MDLAEAKKLVAEGFRPYVCVVKGKRYITLKKGSREVGVGRFDEGIWRELTANTTLQRLSRSMQRKRRRFQSS